MVNKDVKRRGSAQFNPKVQSTSSKSAYSRRREEVHSIAKHANTSSINEGVSRVWETYQHLLQQILDKERFMHGSESVEVKLENVLDVKIEGYVKEREIEHSKETSEENSISHLALVKKQER